MTNKTEVERGAPADLPKLFTVKSVANVNGYHNVPVVWFVDRSLDDEFWSGQPWPALIADDPKAAGYGYTQAAIAELFTESEAKALAAFIETIAPESP
jgi:hypothetical protein